MIFSVEQLFSDDQAITVTAASTNVIDLGATGTVLGGSNALVRDIGRGAPIPILIQVTVDFATLTSLQVTLQAAHVVGFGESYTIAQTPAVVAAELVAGFQFPIIYVPIRTDKRFFRLNYTVAGSNATAGAVTAGIVVARQDTGLAGVAGLQGT